MKKMTEMFENEELVEMVKKNWDFTVDLFKTNMKRTEDFAKENMNEYFKAVNKNLEFLSKNYETFTNDNTEIADLYKENWEKAYDISKTMVEKLRNKK